MTISKPVTQAQGHSNGVDAKVVDPRALLRLPQVLALYPVGASSWWAGVKAGKYPRPVKLGPHTTAWRAADVLELIERLANQPTSANEDAR
jgi:predicted DNA-binding transcriptional regulator AlpA